MKVFNLQTEFLSNPIGVSFVNPIFLWNVSDCEKQTAYQIKIYVHYLDEEMLKDDELNL